MSAVLGKRIDGDQLALRCSRHGIPIAYVQHAYDHGAEIIFVGEPTVEHSCDAMGCGQAHVIGRISKSHTSARLPAVESRLTTPNCSVRRNGMSCLGRSSTRAHEQYPA
jgi:hypothetical protein